MYKAFEGEEKWYHVVTTGKNYVGNSEISFSLFIDILIFWWVFFMFKGKPLIMYDNFIIHMELII